MPRSVRQRHCVIGPGRIGRAVLAALHAADEPVAAVGVRRPGAVDPRLAPPRLAIEEAVRVAAAGNGRLVLWITTADDAIAGVATQAAAALADPASQPATTIATHMSGLGGLELLAPLARAGATTVSLHPLQSFADGAGHETLRGVPVAVTAADDRGLRIGRSLARLIGGDPFPLADEDKTLYHLAAVTAANLLVGLEAQAAELFRQAVGGSAEEAARRLGPLVETTLANLRANGPSAALTGPIARGDVGTVRAHLELLRHQPPRFAEVHRALSLEALALAAPRLDDEAVATLHELLGSYTELGMTGSTAEDPAADAGPRSTGDRGELS